MMTLNEIRYNPASSTFWLVVGLALKKNHHTHDMPLRIESTERHTPHKQVIVVHYYIKKEVQKFIEKLDNAVGNKRKLI